MKYSDVRIKVYDSHENIKKYPMMRKMFHDPEEPFDTKWVIWFDDDSHVTSPDWLTRLSHCMRENCGRGYNMFGKRYFYHINDSQVKWVQGAPWYHKVPLEIHEGVDPRRKKPFKRIRVHFATGGFWTVESAWLQKWDWPDVRICHNGGDVMMGEAIHQTGGNVKNWEYGVKISDAKRRGYSEKPAGAK